jgi:hypothetical protein
MTTEKVNHPAHYNQHPSGIECIQIAEHLNFSLGCAFKYLWRAGSKEGVSAREDLEKALWYVKREKWKHDNFSLFKKFLFLAFPVSYQATFQTEFIEQVITGFPATIGFAMYAIMTYSPQNSQSLINFVQQAIADVDNP